MTGWPDVAAAQEALAGPETATDSRSSPNTTATPAPVETTPGAAPDKKDPCRRGFMGLRKRPPYCDEIVNRKPQYAFLPAVFSTKETSFGAAIYNELTFYTHKTEDVSPSRVALTFTYTVRNQFITRIPVQLFIHKDDYVIDGYVDFRVYPNRYYGVGNDTPWNYQLYRENVITSFFEFRRRITKHLYGGLVWNLRAAVDVAPLTAVDEGGNEVDDPEYEILENQNPPGSEKNFVQGLGAELVFDNRDDKFFPKKGGFHRTLLTYQTPLLGSDFEYLSWDVDLRQFVGLGGQHVLALQGLMQTRFGDAVPFSSLSELGGPAQLRGYFRGRYRDKHYITAQIEYRYPIYKRLSGVAFAAAGEVFGHDSFAFSVLRWTVGGGLRMRFQDTIYMRIDVGANDKTNAVIFNGGQTF